MHLVRRTFDGQYFAMKTIELNHMNSKEQELVKDEINQIKALESPTIIKYYDSFMENNSLYIVMEFAEGGSLCDKIADHKKREELFTNEQILGDY